MMWEKMNIIAFFIIIIMAIFLLCSVESRFNEMQKQIDYLMAQNIELAKKQRVAEQDIYMLAKGEEYLLSEIEKK